MMVIIRTIARFIGLGMNYRYAIHNVDMRKRDYPAVINHKNGG